MTELALSPTAGGEVDAGAAAAATTLLLPVAAVLGELVDPASPAALADDHPRDLALAADRGLLSGAYDQ